MTTTTDRYLPLVAFFVAATAVVLPIVLHPFLPLVDLPNHVARYHVMTQTAGPLLEYYAVDRRLLPNSAVDILWRLLAYPGHPVLFSQLIAAISVVSLIAATMILSRSVHGRWSVWPASTALLAFSSAFFWGFQNYLLTLPVALCGLALWIACERKSLALRFCLFLVLGVVLYLMHLFGFLILAISVLGRELQRLLISGSDWRRLVKENAVLSIPFLVPPFWLIYGSVVGEESIAGGKTTFGPPIARLDALLSPFHASGSMPTSVNVLGLLAFFVVLACLTTVFLKSGPRLRVSPVMAGPLLATAAVSLLAPVMLNGVGFIHIRFPLAFFAMLLASTAWVDVDRSAAMRIGVIFLVIMLARGVAVERFAARHNADMRDLHAVLDYLPAGARLLPLRAPGHESDSRLWHVQAYAVVHRDAFVPTLFQGTHSLRVTDAWRNHAHPTHPAPSALLALEGREEAVAFRPTYLQDWPTKFTHVLQMDEDSSGIFESPLLERLARAGGFTLYRIERQD